MIPRVLEPEAMDGPEEVASYDAMDHRAVNEAFVADFLAVHGPCRGGEILDVGTGTARIPIALALADPGARIVGFDLAPAMLDRAASRNSRNCHPRMSAKAVAPLALFWSNRAARPNATGNGRERPSGHPASAPPRRLPFCVEGCSKPAISRRVRRNDPRSTRRCTRWGWRAA